MFRQIRGQLGCCLQPITRSHLPIRLGRC
jgi:hypothetical protein